MPSKSLSAFLVISSILLSGLIGQNVSGNYYVIMVFGVVGLILGLVCLQAMQLWMRSDVYKIVGGTAGMLLGALLALIVSAALSRGIGREELILPVNGLILVMFCVISIQLGVAAAKELRIKVETIPEYHKTIGILDTSVIIDGRIADVCETGFLDGDLVIPQFVLKELQTIADSSEPTKRTRGRRGLDILNKMKKQSYVKIAIEDTDYPSIKEVDQKLIQMGKETGYAILTNDFNLNKVAEVQSIQVLNINQLANSLKPIVLPGETMKVQILKEGKEHSQGVAYLDDGTMVVVDNGRKQIGKTVDVTVTSVLQTTAGRMIFAIMKL
ncbi:MAG TPA: TRAM domain-containing protein [Desulfomonilaceae bacterium]|nr:TRAM domain-containing protein [Desulfomonilaceae bacterium]